MKKRTKIVTAILCTGIVLNSIGIVYSEEDILSDGAIVLDDGVEDTDSLSELQELVLQKQEAKDESERLSDIKERQDESTYNITVAEEFTEEENKQEETADENNYIEDLELLEASEEVEVGSVGDSNTINTAYPINLNGSTTDSLAKNNEVKWYKFSVPSKGYICIDFSHDYLESSSNYWRIQLYSSDQVEMASYNYQGKEISTKSGDIGVKAGTYYLKVSPSYYSNLNYRITVNFVTSNYWETENNDSKEKANSISTNTIYYGSLMRSNDADWYTFNIPSDGYVSIEFSHDYINSTSNYWRIFLYDSSMQEYTSYTNNGKDINLYSPNFGVKSGKYYIKVIDSYYSSIDYTFRINYSVSGNWETEFNDNNASANNMGLNTSINGGLRNSSDVDWYKITVSNYGHLSFDFKHNYIESSSNYWRILMYDSNIKEMFSYSINGKTIELKTCKVGVKPGTYYIKILDSYYSGTNYTLTSYFTSDSNWEVEFNNDYTSANSISRGVDINGSIMSSSDADWYSVQLPPGTISFIFWHDYIESSSNYWRVNVYDSSFKEIEVFNSSGKNTTVTNDFQNLSGGLYYIKIQDSYFSDLTYHFRLGEQKQPDTVTLNAVTGLKATPIGMNTVSLQWNGSAGATGYFIIRLNPLFSGRQIGYTTSTGYTDSSAYSDGFNFYWVIPFYKSSSGIITKGPTGNYAYAIGRKINKISNVQTVITNSGVRVYWNPDPCANYYVLMSKTGKNSSFNTSKIGPTTSYNDNEISKGQVKYYWVYGVYRDSNRKILAAGPVSNYAWGAR